MICKVDFELTTAIVNSPSYTGDYLLSGNYHSSYAYTFDEFNYFHNTDTFGILTYASGCVEPQSCSYVAYEERELGYPPTKKYICDCSLACIKMSENNYKLSFNFKDEDNNIWHGSYSGALINF